MKEAAITVSVPEVPGHGLVAGQGEKTRGATGCSAETTASIMLMSNSYRQITRSKSMIAGIRLISDLFSAAYLAFGIV
jgi:hypothetical protein